MKLSKLAFLILPVFAMNFAGAAPAPKPPKNKISMEKAEQIATATQAGAIESKELEFENKQWIYSFDIRGNDKMIHEIQVDAKNGKIVSQKTETQSQESDEAAGEKQD